MREEIAWLRAEVERLQESNKRMLDALRQIPSIAVDEVTTRPRCIRDW
jgi:hypothetical protein